jgi:hypothetical protein
MVLEAIVSASFIVLSSRFSAWLKISFSSSMEIRSTLMDWSMLQDISGDWVKLLITRALRYKGRVKPEIKIRYLQGDKIAI